jgi:toxin CptA
MFGPPSVSFKVGRSRWQAVTGVMFVGFGSVTTLAMVLSPHHFPTWAAVFAVIAWACSGWSFYRTLRETPVGTLLWDGIHWHWAGSRDYSVSAISVTMDLQYWMLVRVERISAQPIWLWLERGSRPSTKWIALRRALVHTARRPSAPDALTQGNVYP